MELQDVFKSFTINKKQSASPTIVIINKHVVPPTVLKLWLDTPNTFKDFTENIKKSLDYEKDMYREKIRKIIEYLESKGEDTLFLRYIGDSNCVNFTEIQKYLGIEDDSAEQKTLLKALMYYAANPLKTHVDYNMCEFYSTNVSKFPMSGMRNYLKQTYKCIITPYIKSKTFKKCLKDYSTNDIVLLIKQIIKGIAYLYINKCSHNDLHYENILVDDHNKVYIFDWDRGYSVEIGPNPITNDIFCNTIPASTFCNSGSQCNLYHKYGYSIDFYKILYYILKNRPTDFSQILDSIGIKNQKIGENLAHIIIHHTIVTGNDSFFIKFVDSKGLCSWLQDPSILHNDFNLLFLHSIIGKIQTIYYRITGSDITPTTPSDLDDYKVPNPPGFNKKIPNDIYTNLVSEFIPRDPFSTEIVQHRQPELDPTLGTPVFAQEEQVLSGVPLLSPTPRPVAPEPVAPEPVVQRPVAPEPVAPEPVVQRPVAPEPVAPEPVAPEPVAQIPSEFLIGLEPPVEPIPVHNILSTLGNLLNSGGETFALSKKKRSAEEEVKSKYPKQQRREQRMRKIPADILLKIKNEYQRIKNLPIQNITWKDINTVLYITNYLKYGKYIKPFGKIIEKSKPVESVPITDIMEQNDIRKDKMLKILEIYRNQSKVSSWPQKFFSKSKYEPEQTSFFREEEKMEV